MVIYTLITDDTRAVYGIGADLKAAKEDAKNHGADMALWMADENGIYPVGVTPTQGGLSLLRNKYITSSLLTVQGALDLIDYEGEVNIRAESHPISVGAAGRMYANFETHGQICIGLGFFDVVVERKGDGWQVREGEETELALDASGVVAIIEARYKRALEDEEDEEFEDEEFEDEEFEDED